METTDNAILVRKMVESLVVATVCTGLSVLVAMGFGWVTTINLVELLAVFTSYSCTYLCVVQSRWNYPMGIVSTILYSITFLQVGLVASAALNIYLPFALLYGWMRWGPDRDTRPVTWLGFSAWWVPYIAISGTIFLGLYFITDVLGATLPLFDSIIVAATILAQLLLDNKRIETWFVWAFVNVLAIIVYFSSGLYFVGIQYILFLANTAYGYYQWRQTMKGQEATINFGRFYDAKPVA